MGPLIVQSSISMHGKHGDAIGSGGMLSMKFLKNRCANIEFDDIVDSLMATLSALISKFK